MNKGVLGTVFCSFSKLLGTIKIDFKHDEPKIVIFIHQEISTLMRCVIMARYMTGYMQ